MSIGNRIFAVLYDRMMARTERAGLAAQRAQVLAEASGDVLEVGGGTGFNLPYFPPSVTRLSITEPEPAMLKRLDRRVRQSAPTARVLRAPAEDLPYDDASFDTVVSTLVLCSVDDQPRVVAELRRVLRPSGRLLFIEHVRSGDPKLSRLQDRMDGINRIVARCHCNRPTLDTLCAGGFDIANLQHSTLEKAPPLVRPLVIGTATIAPPIRHSDVDTSRSAR